MLFKDLLLYIRSLIDCHLMFALGRDRFLTGNIYFKETSFIQTVS